MNSINNVVDVTNYVMLEMGQPLHAFDADSLAGGKVLIRNASAGEKFKTLKEQDIILSGEELLICDSEKAVALAGVIGGLNSGVSEGTKNIFLESASFKAMSVRKSSRVHGVETDSAYRFSRGVDPSATSSIMDRAALLILQVAGGEAFGDAYDVHAPISAKKPVKISIKTVSDRLGYTADEKLFLTYMRGLQVKVEKTGEGEYLMTPPVFRFDLEQDMDLVEEYARLYGYEHIQESIPALRAEPAQHDAVYLLNQKVSQLVRSEGYSQAFNYAFTSDAHESAWLGENKVSAVKIRNPLSEELNVMRRSLTYGLWKNTLDNIRGGNDLGQLFEIGQIFSKSESAFVEQSRLAIINWGEAKGIFAGTAPPVYQVRSAVEKLLQSLQISSYSFVSAAQPPVHLHAGQWAQVLVEGQYAGYIGTVHPGLLDSEKVRVPVALAELDLGLLLKGQPRPVKFKALSKFQPVERDFAFVMQTEKAIGDLVKEARKACGTQLRNLNVFDIYEGDKLQAGQKSVALRAHFQSTEADLTESEIQQLCSKLVEAAKKSVNAELR